MPDYTHQLTEIVELIHREPAIPQWTIAIIGAGIGGLIGFLSAIAVSTINRWKDRRSLQDSLCSELDLIFSDLNNHVELLKKQPDQTRPGETNFTEFTKADLFQAVQRYAVVFESKHAWATGEGPPLVKVSGYSEVLERSRRYHQHRACSASRCGGSPYSDYSQLPQRDKPYLSFGTMLIGADASCRYLWWPVSLYCGRVESDAIDGRTTTRG